MRPATPSNLGAQSAYATLALGSALALLLYPHAMTGVLSSSSSGVIKRNAVALPAYSFALGLIALLGFMAVAAGREDQIRYSPTASRRSAPTSRCRRCSCSCSRHGSWASRSRPSPSARWCRPRSCPSPAPISSPATSTANISSPTASAAARMPGRQDRFAGGEVRRAFFILELPTQYAIQLQLLGGI